VNEMPGGNVSVSETLVAWAAPSLVTSMAKLTVSPSAGLALPLASVLTVITNG